MIRMEMIRTGEKTLWKADEKVSADISRKGGWTA